MTTRDPRSLYAAYVDSLNVRDFGRLPEFVPDTLSVNGASVSRAQYIDAIRQLMEPVENFTWSVEDLIVEGERIAARLTVTGTPTGEWLGLKPTGAAVTFSDYAFYQVRDGRLASIWFLLDIKAIESQLPAG